MTIPTVNVRITYPTGFNPPGRSSVSLDSIKLGDLALADGETVMAQKIEIVDDDGTVLRVLKDRRPSR